MLRFINSDVNRIYLCYETRYVADISGNIVDDKMWIISTLEMQHEYVYDECHGVASLTTMHIITTIIITHVQ